MKKYFNNKKYDTTTADNVGVNSNNMPGDLKYFEETLYRKRTGEFFLYGKGGPASKYAESYGSNTWGSGERIIPLSLDAAKKWAKENLTGDEYESIFGAVEDDTKRVVSISLTITAHEKVKRLSQESGIPVSEWIETAIMNA